MALTACRECRQKISQSAKACPKCGATIKRTSPVTMLVAIFLGVSVVIGLVAQSSANKTEESRRAAMTPEQIAAETTAKEKANLAIQTATAGALTLKKAMRNPDSFKLESALVINDTNAVCYDYHAQNGFGGMNVGHAVLSSDGKRFKTDEMEGFASLWNKECANKNGKEEASGINWLAL